MSSVPRDNVRDVVAARYHFGFGGGLHFWALTALLFFFIYDLSFIAAPSVTTGRVALLLVLFLVSGKLLPAVRDFVVASWGACLVLALTAVYAAAQYLEAGLADRTQLARLLYFGLYSVLGAIAFALVFRRDADRFAFSFSVATAIQSALIFYSFLSPHYRLWLAGMLVQGGNIPLTDPTRAPGLTNSSGALLSLIQSLGVFVALFAARRARGVRVWALCLLALVDLASTVVVARTGLLYGLAFIGLFLLIGRRSVRMALLAMGGTCAVVVLAFGGGILGDIQQRNMDVGDSLSRTAEIFVKGTKDTSVRELTRQPVPPLTTKTFFGTGLVADPYWGNASGNDSGYVQTYYALGLPMAVIAYAAVAGLLGTHVLRSRAPVLLGVLAVMLFVLDLKEPFIFKYTYAFLVLALALMTRRPGCSRLSQQGA